MKRFIIPFALLASSFLVLPNAQAAKFKIDTSHSSVTFKIRHFLSKTAGRFTQFKGSVHFNAKKPKRTKIYAVIQTNSINTDNKKRDNHLKKKDFFHTAKYKKITFKSTKVKNVVRKGKKIHFDLVGKLTIKKTTRTVTLKVVYGGTMKIGGHFGTRSAFTAKTSINRHKFGVSTGKKMMRMALGAKVAIEINIEGVQTK